MSVQPASAVLVVGSVALDSVETPFGRADDVLGGSGTFFASSASHFAPVQLVGVVGDDYPMEQLSPLAERGVDVDHVTLFRWVQRFTPILIDAADPSRAAVGDLVRR